VSNRYAKLAKELVARAKRRGADAAEAYLQVGRESSVTVRGGEVEDLTQATSKGVGLRVFVKGRLGFAFTSDFEPGSLAAFVDRAVELARAAAPDKLNGLPDKSLLKGRKQPEGLFDPAVANLASDWKLRAALEVEKAGRSVDGRITTFDSVGAGDYVSEVHVASTEGLTGSYEGTYVFLYAVPVASENGQLQTAHWMDYKRHLADLDSPESVGREAARRALRMLGARKVKSQRVPVIFEPQVAASFVGNLVAPANGDAVYKKASVFAGRLGEKLAPGNFTVVDDGLLARGLGSSPFDGEGIPTRRMPLVDRGVLRNFLYDAYTARKAKAAPTGNASRGYSSLPHVGVHNLYLEPGTETPEALIRGVKQGLYVTSMLGSGANPVTGDYSRGANGLWIENGELTFPVQEITVAGNLLQMLEDVDGIGNDLRFRSSVAAPTLRFRELTVSGT
jgi:PmbA protein